MKTIEITGTLREEFGKTTSKALRIAGCVPCVIYGGEENAHFYVTNEGLRHLVYSPEIFLVNLTIGTKKCTAILKDLQFHPVSDALLHVDFMEVFANKPIIMNVPVVLEGLAEGVQAGGKLTLERRNIAVKGLYSDVPEKLFVNVDALGLGKTIQVAELSFDKLEIVSPKENVVCSVKLTRAARGAAAEGK
ncbi:MAG TPA: 50S ribosomal protein L25/general stress protein Ctc [Bacteroidales bacterium]